jgi:hypothetical protein
MKRRALSDLPVNKQREAEAFIEAGKPKPQEPDGPKEEPLVEGDTLITQTYRLPQRIVRRLLLASTERKLAKKKPWSQQDIVAEAIQEWLDKHASK